MNKFMVCLAVILAIVGIVSSAVVDKGPNGPTPAGPPAPGEEPGDLKTSQFFWPVFVGGWGGYGGFGGGFGYGGYGGGYGGYGGGYGGGGWGWGR